MEQQLDMFDLLEIGTPLIPPERQKAGGTGWVLEITLWQGGEQECQ